MLTLYVDTSSNQLIASVNNPIPISAGALPLFLGDTLPLNIYLLANAGPQAMGANPFTIIPNQGLQVMVYITDGTYNGTIYTQQIAFTQDAGGQFFSGNLSLNTPALVTLFNGGTKASATLIIAFQYNGGLQQTVISQTVNLVLGAPANAIPQVPPGLTPLSAEAAAETYVRIDGNPNDPGGGQIFISPNGKKIYAHAVDRPDGTAAMQFDPMN